MMPRAFLLVLLASGLGIMQAQTPATIVNIVVDSTSHTTLEALVTRAELATTLSTGNYTLFAPTDTAFTNLGSSTLVSKITADPLDDKWKPLLQDVLKYHVVNGFVRASDLPTSPTAVATLSGDSVALQNTAPQILNGSTTVTGADNIAGNGVVHIVDKVLLPPSTGRNVVDIAVSTGVHTTLVSLLQTAGLDTTLQGDSINTAYTVFAPTDAAFNKLDSATLTCLQAAENAALLADVLKFHVVESSTVMSSMLVDGMAITPMSVGGKQFTFVSGTQLMASSSSMITTADVLGTNGVVHVVDTVLIPDYFSCPTTIVNTVVDSAAHTTLETLLGQSSLVPTLQGSGNFTLFAPTDTAFNSVDAAMTTKLASGGQWQPLLDEILKHHVLAKSDAPVLAADLPATAASFDTLVTGEPLSIKAAAPQISGAATVGSADLTSSNGVVHAIDAVLLPSVATRTVVTIVANSANHTTLESLLGNAELLATLGATDASSAFTVFAPTDAAFAAVDADTMACLGLAGNKELLANLLKYHVVAGVTTQSGLSGLSEVTTLYGNETITVNAAFTSAVVTADLLASNGIVHVINTVLLPAGFVCDDSVPTTDSASATGAPLLATIALGVLSLLFTMA